MKLHYSQTFVPGYKRRALFQYLMKLHYSQTSFGVCLQICLFQYLMKLHYSQTNFKGFNFLAGFSTLWNYTTLKRVCNVLPKRMSFSTLWNYTTLKRESHLLHQGTVSVPYEITLLSNLGVSIPTAGTFQYLMKLHYSQTCYRRNEGRYPFQYLMKLHYSQTWLIFQV